MPIRIYITSKGRQLEWEEANPGDPIPSEIQAEIDADNVTSFATLAGVGDERETHEEAYDHEALVSGSHSHANKTLLDTYTQTEVDIADVISKEHEHTNKTELDLISDGDHDVRTDNPHSVTKTQVGLADVPNLDTTSAVANDHAHTNKTELDLVTDGDHDAITTGNPHSVTKAEVGLGDVPNLDTTSAVSNDHTHTNKATLDTYTQSETDLADAVSKKHTQNSDTILDEGGANEIAASAIQAKAFTPTTGGDWTTSPTTIQAALDELAARVKTLESA